MKRARAKSLLRLCLINSMKKREISVFSKKVVKIFCFSMENKVPSKHHARSPFSRKNSIKPRREKKKKGGHAECVEIITYVETPRYQPTGKLVARVNRPHVLLPPARLFCSRRLQSDVFLIALDELFFRSGRGKNNLGANEHFLKS